MLLGQLHAAAVRMHVFHTLISCMYSIHVSSTAASTCNEPGGIMSWRTCAEASVYAYTGIDIFNSDPVFRCSYMHYHAHTPQPPTQLPAPGIAVSKHVLLLREIKTSASPRLPSRQHPSSHHSIPPQHPTTASHHSPAVRLPIGSCRCLPRIQRLDNCQRVHGEAASRLAAHGPPSLIPPPDAM